MLKTVVIIGGSKGIGLEITKTFLDNNYLVITGSRTSPKIKHKNLYFFSLDVRKESNFQNFFKSIQNITKVINVLINNTGLSEWKKIEDINLKFLNKMYETNVYYLYWSCKHALKLFPKKKSKIINISSLAGKRGSKNNSVYSATKFAVNGITQSLAKELGNRSILVNAICPVLIETPGLVYALKQKDSPSNGKNINKFLSSFKKLNSANNQLPTSKDIADFALFLASDLNNSITGQCINVDCGVLPQ